MVAQTEAQAAAARKLIQVDATCPLVTKVHVQARRYAAEKARAAFPGVGSR